jgi:hypothetical protein
MPFTPITGGVDWQHVDFVNEYVRAFNERKHVVNLHLEINLKSVGNDIQYDFHISNLQSRYLEFADEFVDPDPTSYDGDADYPVEMTESEMLIKAEIPNGYRRATAKPANWTNYTDPAFTYGIAVAGDIAGPWLWADLQAVASVCTRTKSVVSGYPTSWTEGYLGGG